MNMYGHPPIIKTPLTDVVNHLGSPDIQIGGLPQCRKFEMQLMDCIQAYGIEKSYERCVLLYEDLKECKSSEKQLKRFHKIKDEREKQFKEGKLKKRYAETPNLETHYTLQN